MKICLISPAGQMYGKQGIFPRFLRYAPLTLTTLASLVPDDLDAEVEIIDEGVSKINLDKIDADIVGISAITGTANRSYYIADELRKKGHTVVLGGVHPTLLANEAKLHADSVVIGHGFESFKELLKDFSKGKLKPFYYQKDSLNLENLPTPKRNMMKRFGYINNGAVQAIYGCPNGCDFCATTTFQNKYLKRPIDEVILEIQNIKSNFIVFVDPSPVSQENREYLKELWQRMIPLKKRWAGLSTVQIASDDELLDLATKSGCSGLLIGFESICQDGLKKMNKSFNNFSDYKKIVKKLHDRRIIINGTFLFGTDEDDKDCFKRTVDFIHEAQIDLPRFSIYTPFPGTPLFNRLYKENRILSKNWDYYDVQHCVFKPAKMTPQELWEGNVWAWEETYKLKNILHRINYPKSRKVISLITNLGYRYYANRLKNYPNEEFKIDKKIY